MPTEGSNPTASLTCLVADRHPEMRESLAQLLAHEGFEVVGTAASGREADRLLEAHRPEIMVLDLRLDTMTGIDVAREAARLDHPAVIVLYTSDAAQTLVQEALAAGVRGIAREAVPPVPLLKAIAAAVAGEVYVDPSFGDFSPSP